jgi:hypothetical protein
MSISQENSKLPYTLLRQVKAPARMDKLKVFETPPLMADIMPWIQTEEETAIDLETTGNKTYLPSTVVVTIAMANSHGAFSIDLRNNPEYYNQLLGQLYAHKTKLFCHNLFFDGSLLTRDLNRKEDGTLPEWFHEWKWLNFVGCTYAKAKHLSTEGWPGQQWGLKFLAGYFLGWEETQEKEKNRWMIENGIVKRKPKKALLAKLYGQTLDNDEEES